MSAPAPPIEGLISDYGGVLTAPLMEAMSQAATDIGTDLITLGRAMALMAERDGGEMPLYRLETGRMTETDYLGGLGEAVGELLGRPFDASGFSQAMFANLHPNEELLTFLRALKAEGLPMALCTNNVKEWEPLWRPRLPIDEIFEVVVDSGFLGFRKPAPEIYLATIERLGTDPHRTLFLDDMDINCDAARTHGLQAIHFQTTAQAIAEIERALGRS